MSVGRRGGMVAGVALGITLLATGCGGDPPTSHGNRSTVPVAGTTVTRASGGRSRVSVAPAATAPQWGPQRIVGMLHARYPGAHHWRILTGDQWQGLLSPTERVVVTVDPTNGAITDDSGPQGTSAAAEMVQGFYNLLASGDQAAAWSLLNPASQNPNPSFRYPQTYQAFLVETKATGARVQEIRSADWALPGPGYKYEPCECLLFGGGASGGGGVDVTASLTNGTTEYAYVLRGADGAWTLFWDYGTGALT